MFERANHENPTSTPPDIDDINIDDDADDMDFDGTTITPKTFPFPFLICFMRFFFLYREKYDGYFLALQ